MKRIEPPTSNSVKKRLRSGACKKVNHNQNRNKVCCICGNINKISHKKGKGKSHNSNTKFYDIKNLVINSISFTQHLIDHNISSSIVDNSEVICGSCHAAYRLNRNNISSKVVEWSNFECGCCDAIESNTNLKDLNPTASNCQPLAIDIPGPSKDPHPRSPYEWVEVCKHCHFKFKSGLHICTSKNKLDNIEAILTHDEELRLFHIYFAIFLEVK